MKKEKYIVPRYSTIKGQEKTIVSFVFFRPYSVGGEKKTVSKTFKVKNYKTARDALKAAINERNRWDILISEEDELVAATVKKKMMTVGQLFELIPQYYPLSKGTIKKYSKMYEGYIKPKYDKTKIKDVTMINVQETLQKCADRCVQREVGNVKTIWHRMFQIAENEGINIRDLSTRVQMPSSNKVTARSLGEQNITEEDFQKFCEAMSEYGRYPASDKKRIYNRDIILWMLKVMRITGLRPQEVKALRRKDITFGHVEIPSENAAGVETKEIANIMVSRSIGSTISSELSEKKTKTPQSKRVIPVVGKDVDIIRNAMEYSKYDLIFADYKGNPFSADAVSDLLGRVSRSCGIKVYAGLMRKAFAADHYRQGTSPVVIKKLMGHKSENMSINWYATASNAELLDAMASRKFKAE